MGKKAKNLGSWTARRTAAATAGLAAMAISTAAGGSMLEGIGMASAGAQGMDALLEGSKRTNDSGSASAVEKLDEEEKAKTETKDDLYAQAYKEWEKNKESEEWKALMDKARAIKTLDDAEMLTVPVKDADGNVQTRKLESDKEIMENYGAVHENFSNKLTNYNTSKSKAARIKKWHDKANSITDSEIEKGQKDIEALLRKILARRKQLTSGTMDRGTQDLTIEDLQALDPTAKALTAAISKDALEGTQYSAEEIASQFGLGYLQGKGGLEDTMYSEMIEKIKSQQELVRYQRLRTGQETNRQIMGVDGKNASMNDVVDDVYYKRVARKMKDV